MKKTIVLILVAIGIHSGLLAFGSDHEVRAYKENQRRERVGENLTNSIPEMNLPSYVKERYEYIPGVMELSDSNWDNVVGVARNISMREAFALAESHPEVTYFFHVTWGKNLFLRVSDNDYRIVNEGDFFFFSGEPSWEEAASMADGYLKLPQ